jgi:hypothetical protein
MYRKNVAGQHVCFQLLLTATGAVATGLTPSVRRCIDGTFAAGGGTVTEDGTTGSYKYAMSQADTNGNNISFIFTGTGAMPVCVNIVTTAADPTDTVRFGLTAMPNVASGNAGALIVSGTGTAALSVSSGLVTLAGVTHTGAVIPTVTTTTTATNVTTVNGLAANVITAASIAADAITDAKVAADVTIASVTGAVGSVTGAVGSVTGAVGSVTAAVTVGTNNDKTGYALTSGERTSVADAILDRDMSTGSDSGSSTVRTMRQALRFLRNKFAIVAGTLTVYKEDDTTASWTAAITTTAGNPVSSSDPAGP